MKVVITKNIGLLKGTQTVVDENGCQKEVLDFDNVFWNYGAKGSLLDQKYQGVEVELSNDLLEHLGIALDIVLDAQKILNDLASGMTEADVRKKFGIGGYSHA